MARHWICSKWMFATIEISRFTLIFEVRLPRLCWHVIRGWSQHTRYHLGRREQTRTKHLQWYLQVQSCILGERRSLSRGLKCCDCPFPVVPQRFHGSIALCHREMEKPRPGEVTARTMQPWQRGAGVGGKAWGRALCPPHPPQLSSPLLPSLLMELW